MFCDSNTGADYDVTSDNVFYDRLKTALATKQKVPVGVLNIGKDLRTASDRTCINRVILPNP